MGLRKLAWGVLENMTSTGKVRPGIWKTGTPPKKLANFLESSVAEVTTRWKSRLLATTCMRNPLMLLSLPINLTTTKRCLNLPLHSGLVCYG